jgi:hypothetical protein
MGPAPGAPVRSVSGSRSVRVGVVLSGSGPQGSGSDPGPASMGLIGSRSQSRSDSYSPRLAPASAQSGSIAQSWVLFGSGPPRVEHPLSPTRRHPVQLQASRARLRSRSVEHMGLIGSCSVRLVLATPSSGSGQAWLQKLSHRSCSG